VENFALQEKEGLVGTFCSMFCLYFPYYYWSVSIRNFRLFWMNFNSVVKLFHWIWDSHRSQYEDCHLLHFNAVWSQSSLTLLWNVYKLLYN
jgi:hypothetical protein